jgi:hypothetical protein
VRCGFGEGPCPIVRSGRDCGLRGNKQSFDTAISEFAIDYAGQNERDYGAFERAIQDGRLERTIDNID